MKLASLVLQVAMLICLGLTIVELRSVKAELATIKRQMEDPQGARPARFGGGIPVYLTDGPKGK